MAKFSLHAQQAALTKIDPLQELRVDHAATSFFDATALGHEPSATQARVDTGSVLLGRFTLLEMIGEGSMSRIFRAVDRRIVEAGSADPHIAIKVLTLPFASRPDALTVLSRDAESLQALAHPNIQRVFGCERDGETVFLTMELLSGQSLAEKTRAAKSEGGLSRDISRRLIKAIAEALEFAHRRDVLHGALKPANVFITNAGEVKVMDFGLARLGITPDRAVQSGSYTFDSEQAHSLTNTEMPEAGPDPRDDVYALACLAWTLLTGELPDPDLNGEPVTCPRQLTQREFQALGHALQLERSKRTASPRQFLQEFGGSGSRLWPRLAVAIAISLAALIITASIFLHPHKQEMPAQSASPHTLTVSLAPAPGTIFRDCPTCPLMKVLAGGEFQQGSAAGIDALAFEMPQHKVSIAYSFAAGVNDVTVDEYSAFVAATGVGAHSCAAYDGAWRVKASVTWKNAVEAQTPSHPVTCVSWQDAKDYADWLTHTTHQTYRLPSASEWEYIARAGSLAQVPWTTPAEACAYANVADQTAAQQYQGWKALPCSDGFVQSAPVGSFQSNAFGLHDMLGNVFQWTEDCWNDNYQGAPTDGTPQASGDCTQHELRGGSWFTQPEYVRSAYRNRFDGNYRSTSVGFRLIRELSK